MEMILDLFAGGHSVTVIADDGFTSATADKTSDVAKDAEVTITPVMKTGKEVAEYEVVAGGVTVTIGDEGVGTFDMGEANVTIYAKSKANNKYLVTEECWACLNGGTPTVLHKNAKVVLTPNGVPKAVEAEEGGATVTVDAAIQNLIDQGILVKI